MYLIQDEAHIWQGNSKTFIYFKICKSNRTENVRPGLCFLLHLQYLLILQKSSHRLSSTHLCVLPTNNYFESMSAGLELCGL